jgi:phenylalanyl-tRNA synthetase beta chain
MVSLNINKQQLFKDLGKKETTELIEQIPMMGVEVNENTKTELSVDITPNRPDLLSQQGFTRAFAAFLDIRPGLRTYITTPSKLKVYVDESVKNIRPFTACAVIRNLKLDEEKLKELIDVQEKLHTTFARRRKKAAIGIYPMENIQGNITFTALEPKEIKFRPLESEKEMSAQEILEHHPKGKDYSHLLQGLAKYPLFLDSKKNVLSMPPIINSHTTGKVTTATTEVFLEASGFDLRICNEIVQMICAATADMGATIHSVEVIYSKKTEITPDMSTKRQEFYGYYISKRLGIMLKEEEFATLLAKMGIGFEKGRIKETYYALIPPYRVDFLHQVDVLEDIAIAYGYNNIPANLPSVATLGGESPTSKFIARLRKVLVGYGLLEAKNYHLLGKQYQTAIDGNAELVTLKNSVSEGYDALRKTLLAGMLQMLTRNKMHEYPQGFFEVGRVFSPAPEHVDEAEHLAITLAGEVDYTKVRQVVDGVLLALGLKGEFTSHDDIRFLKGRCAQLIVDGVAVGVLGEIAPRVLAHAELVVPVAAAELDVNVLQLLVKPSA